MPFLDDFECKCGWSGELLLDARSDTAPCPMCGKTAKKVMIKAPDYHMSIEMFLENKRGHLEPKIKKSMQKEAAMKKAVAQRRKLAASGGVIPINKG